MPSTLVWASTTTTLPTYANGQTATYRLQPTLSSPVPGGAATDLLVGDCLPVNTTFESASPQPRFVGSDQPSWSKITCEPGETYVGFLLTDLEPNQPLEPITIRARILETAPTGVLMNEALATATGDTSTLEQRGAKARLQLQTPDGLYMSKAASTRYIYVDEVGFVSNLVNDYRIVVRAIQADAVSGIDLIDVLPKAGIDGTTFTASSTLGDFVSAEVVAGSAVTLLHTSTPVPAANVDTFQDPAVAAVNGPAGSTTWCTAPAGGDRVSGTGTCRGAASEVTALRILHPATLAGSAEFIVDVQPSAAGGKTGDVMVNDVFGRAVGLDVPLTSSARIDYAQSLVPYRGYLSGIA